MCFTVGANQHLGGLAPQLMPGSGTDFNDRKIMNKLIVKIIIYNSRLLAYRLVVFNELK